MNKYTLTFHDPKYEQQFVSEQIQIETTILKKFVIVLVIVTISSSIDMWLNGYLMNGFVFLGVSGVILIAYRVCLRKVLYFDIFVLILQLALNTMFPLLILAADSETCKIENKDRFSQYQAGLMISYFSFSCLLGSKYYIKAVPFIYSVGLQLTIMGINKVPFQFPAKAFFILSALGAIVSLYQKELGRRRNFISSQRSNQCNLNVLSSFSSPYFYCYLDAFSIKLIEASRVAQHKYNISDQRQFLDALRSTDLGTNLIPKLNLEQYLYKVFQHQEEVLQNGQIIARIGTFRKQQFKYYISKYLDEDKSQIIMVTFKKYNKQAPLPIEELHKFIIRQLIETLLNKVEPLIDRLSVGNIVYGLVQSIRLDISNAITYSNFKTKDQLVRLNLKQSITNIIQFYQDRLKKYKIFVRVSVKKEAQIILSPQRATHQLIVNLFETLFIIMSN